jgi:hypothetical protein
VRSGNLDAWKPGAAALEQFNLAWAAAVQKTAEHWRSSRAREYASFTRGRSAFAMDAPSRPSLQSRGGNLLDWLYETRSDSFRISFTDQSA